MTRLLKKAINAVERLPESDQDAVAAIVLEELASEKRWTDLFDKSQDKLAKLAGDKKYEADILRSFEKGEWKPIKNLKKEMDRYREAAAETLLKNRRVNIRISAMDLEGLQAKAAAEGLPYQTLMASVLHKYVSGRLVEGPARITSRSRVVPRSGRTSAKD